MKKSLTDLSDWVPTKLLCVPYQLVFLMFQDCYICSYTNHFKNCKAMNEEHFKFYWLYILDLKNLMVEKKLGQVANPTCTERQRLQAVHVRENVQL